MKEKMGKILKFLPSIIFNVAETIAIILIGVLLLHLNIIDTIIIMLVFGATRIATNSAIHYKNWKLCLIWSILQLTSLFLTVKANLGVGIGTTIFAGIILSGKGNIQDMFMWGGNALNNEVFNWVKFNQNNEKLMKYESKLKETDKQKYYIFIYRFREFKPYNKIAKIMGMDEQRISDEIKIMSHFIEYSIRLD